MKGELEEKHEDLQTLFSDATHDLTQVAQVFSNRDTNEERQSKLESLPPEVRAAIRRQDELSNLAYGAAKNLAGALAGRGESLESIAVRLGTTAASVEDMLAVA